MGRLSPMPNVRHAVVAVLLLAAAGLAARAQEASRLDLSVNYVATVGNAQPGNCGCFVMNGGGTEEAYSIRRPLAVVADFSVVHTNNVSGGGGSLGLATYLFGPRYSLRTHSRFTPYAQGLVGGVHGFDAVFPGVVGSTSTNGFAFALGGGVELAFRKRYGFRLAEASFLRTNLPNNTTGAQNNLKVGAGVVFHFH